MVTFAGSEERLQIPAEHSFPLKERDLTKENQDGRLRNKKGRGGGEWKGKGRRKGRGGEMNEEKGTREEKGEGEKRIQTD